MSEKLKKKCLVVSYGPVPTPEFQTVEGGGMRAWGLAKGLKSNDIEVTVAVNNSFPQTIKAHEGIKLINWSQDEDFITLINSFDSVLMSYCMGDPSVFIVDNISPAVQLLLDVYVPIYVEVSAREAKDMPTEYSAYSQDIARHNKVLQRGDYFLCANEVQKIFYTGVLGSLGIVNPLSYRQDKIRVVPFGIHSQKNNSTEDPYLKLGISKEKKRVLWFGGLYPWFRIEELLTAIKELSENDKDFTFILVGGKNPFNNNPDLLRQYEIATKFAKDSNLLDKQIYFVDWVDYDTRNNWYDSADFVISINQPGEENVFAWRTRVMDYIWGELVALTNGGDPLGDELIANGAAIKLQNLDSTTIVRAIHEIYKDKSVLKNAKSELQKIKKKYIWENITKPVADVINLATLNFQFEQEFVSSNNIFISNPVDTDARQPNSRNNKVLNGVKKSKKLLAHARQKGIRRSAKLGVGIIKNQLVKKTVNPRKFIFISHPIDHTGAPLVLLQIIDEAVKKFGSKNIRIIAPFVFGDIEKKLRAKGIKIEKAAEMSYRMAAAQLALSKNDFVLMNTVAINDCYREVVLNMLETKRLDQAHWFIHEDEAQLKVVKGVIEEPQVKDKMSKLINGDQLHIFVPAKRVKKFYDKLFSTKKVHAVPLQLDVPKTYQNTKKVSNFKSIRFLLTGASSDGRKGQLIAITAFQAFLLKYENKNPKAYRDFSVDFISIGEDYVSTQVKTIGKSVLGKRMRTYPALARTKALSVANDCNAVLCCSLNETFGLYIAEGMLMGHIVLRNDSAGREEQLAEGKNGYFIDSNDVNQMADVFEKLLNKKKTTDSDLMRMSKTSQEMMSAYRDNKYLENFNI